MIAPFTHINRKYAKYKQAWHCTDSFHTYVAPTLSWVGLMWSVGLYTVMRKLRWRKAFTRSWMLLLKTSHQTHIQLLPPLFYLVNPQSLKTKRGGLCSSQLSLFLLLVFKTPHSKRFKSISMALKWYIWKISGWKEDWNSQACKPCAKIIWFASFLFAHGNNFFCIGIYH